MLCQHAQRQPERQTCRRLTRIRDALQRVRQLGPQRRQRALVNASPAVIQRPCAPILELLDLL